MATVRKRAWTTRLGEKKTAWDLTYMDALGARHRKQFARKADADAERVRVEGQLAGGIHVPDRDSRSVADAAKAFLSDFQTLVTAGKRERATLSAYDQQVRHHLEPYSIAARKLSRLNGPDCTSYARALESTLSDAMATRVFALFRQIMKFAQASGWLASNPSAAVTIRTSGDRDDDDAVFIPPKAQLKALYTAAKDFDAAGQAEALVTVLMFAGLRASELRGLPRKNLFLADCRVKVTQRADRWQVIGPVKTKKALRTVPIPSAPVQALKRWLMSAPPSELGLVFPTGAGTVQSYTNLYNRLWVPLMTAAGLVTWVDDETGQAKAKPFFALHTLRHVAVSLWIEQGASPKQVTTWAGHASIQFTQDTYGHLWTDAASDQAIASAAQQSVLG